MTELQRLTQEPDGSGSGEVADGSIEDLLERVRTAVEQTREVIATTRETLARPIDGIEETPAGGD